MAGNADLIKEFAPAIQIDTHSQKITELQSQGKTILLVAKSSELCGVIAVRDSVAEGSKNAIQTLANAQLKTIMLSGDAKTTAEAIAKELGIAEVNAQMLPADKAKAVADAKASGLCTAMVGDGINDAPALTSADVGIAIGSGTDIAMDCADIVIMRNDISCVVRAIELSKATTRIIRQNLFWAFFYNVLTIPIAAGCLSSFSIKLNPMIAAAAMSLSSLCVVSNALRLKRK